ncbi:MAG: hypothetical protein Q9160_005906 [Pyrenula sp. 1 TL-2023]
MVATTIATSIPFREAYPDQAIYNDTARNASLNPSNPTRVSGGDSFFIDLISAIPYVFGKDIRDWFDRVLGAQPPTCCDGDDPPYPCRFNAGKTVLGNGFQSCWKKGVEEIIDADVEVMKCIINLHYLKAIKCITITEDACGADYGGGLMKGEMAGWGEKGFNPGFIINDQDSKTLQGAAESMRGHKILYQKANDVHIKLVTIDGDGQDLVTEIDFAGHQGREC